MYPIIEIADDASEAPEQVGSKYKFWYDDRRQMFKLGREGTGEHWAEKIASELCTLLGLPHASYEFAKWRGRLGTTTTNFVPHAGRLVLGNELLGSFVPGYEGTQKYKARQHTISRVMAAMGPQISPPIGVPAGFDLTAPRDFLAGYVLLDAWIGNTDRHHENWGLVLAGIGIHLAPTFDHASSLGRELSDDERSERLETKDKGRNVGKYAVRARSGFYGAANDDKPLSTFNAFQEARRWAPAGAAYWLGRLCHVTAGHIDAILSEIPDEIISIPARKFAKAMLLENQKRICSNE